MTFRPLVCPTDHGDLGTLRAPLSSKVLLFLLSLQESLQRYRLQCKKVRTFITGSGITGHKTEVRFQWGKRYGRKLVGADS